MEGFPPGSAWGFSPLTINTAFVRGGQFGRRCAASSVSSAVLSVSSHAVIRAQPGGTCARTGGRGMLSALLWSSLMRRSTSSWPSQLPELLPIQCVLFACRSRSMHWHFDPCLGSLERPRRCNTLKTLLPAGHSSQDFKAPGQTTRTFLTTNSTPCVLIASCLHSED